MRVCLGANIICSQANTKFEGKMNIMSRCPRTFTAAINDGGRVKSQAHPPPNSAIYPFHHFATKQKYTKSLLFFSRPFLQQCVPFRKSQFKIYCIYYTTYLNKNQVFSNLKLINLPKDSHKISLAKMYTFQPLENWRNFYATEKII